MMLPNSLDLFDASCMLGRSAVRQPGTPTTAAKLLDSLKSAGISSALVYHADAAEYDFQPGNRRLIDDIRDYPELVPCWIVGPHQTGEFPEPPEMIRMMREAGVRAARIVPNTHRFLLREWNIGPLLEQLEESRTPVWIDFSLRGWTDEAIDWDGLYTVCSSYPSLPVVLVCSNIASNRRLYPLMERCPNLLIESSYYTVHRGLELLVQTFGGHRILFGTGFPTRPAGPAITALTYSQIDDRDKALIAGANLRALLEGVNL